MSSAITRARASAVLVLAAVGMLPATAADASVRPTGSKSASVTTATRWLTITTWSQDGNGKFKATGAVAGVTGVVTVQAYTNDTCTSTVAGSDTDSTFPSGRWSVGKVNAGNGNRWARVSSTSPALATACVSLGNL